MNSTQAIPASMRGDLELLRVSELPFFFPERVTFRSRRLEYSYFDAITATPELHSVMPRVMDRAHLTGGGWNSPIRVWVRQNEKSLCNLLRLNKEIKK
jgi:hypothetical protein